MKRLLMSGVAAFALGATALPAHAQQTTQGNDSQCVKNLDKVRTDLQGDKTFSETYRAGAIDASDYERLRRAAITFSRNGMNERCEDVVAGMRELAKRQSVEYGKRDRTADSKDVSERERRRMAELKSAQSLERASVSIETIMGKDVRNLRDVDLGDVEDVVTTNGKIEHVIIGRGGFMGIGVAYYQVAWNNLKITQDNDTVVLEVTEKQIEAMPKVEKKDGRWVAAADGTTTEKPMDKKKSAE